MFLAMPSWPRRACSSPVQRTFAGGPEDRKRGQPAQTADLRAVLAARPGHRRVEPSRRLGRVFSGGVDDEAGHAGLSAAPIRGHDASGRHRRTALLEGVMAR
jgi:hypothetical protein